MQEIARGIYIETAYIGVTLGAISMPHGLVLVDAPPRPDDVRSWRSALLNLGGGVDRLLVNLDAHVDRTLGDRAMECTVLAHDKTSQIFRNRPTTFKAQGMETGAEWEQVNGLGSVRWAPPEMAFTERMVIHWGDTPLVMEYHPGPNPGAIWVIQHEARVMFIGDAVIPNQPPYLANADLPVWMDTLQLLLEPSYRDYLLVGGRTGLVPVEEVYKQLDYLRFIHEKLEEFAERKEPPEATEGLIPVFLEKIQYPAAREDMYAQRLRWGLTHYFNRHYRPATEEGEEL